MSILKILLKVAICIIVMVASSVLLAYLKCDHDYAPYLIVGITIGTWYFISPIVDSIFKK